MIQLVRQLLHYKDVCRSSLASLSVLNSNNSNCSTINTLSNPILQFKRTVQQISKCWLFSGILFAVKPFQRVFVRRYTKYRI